MSQKVSRAAVASFLLQAATDGLYSRRAVIITGDQHALPSPAEGNTIQAVVDGRLDAMLGRWPLDAAEAADEAQDPALWLDQESGAPSARPDKGQNRSRQAAKRPDPIGSGRE